MSGAITETTISKRIRVAVARTKLAIVVRCNVGLAVPYNQACRGEMQPIRYGLGNGTPDLVGVLLGSGRCFCLEVKTDTGRVSPDQHAWHAVMKRRGAFVAVVRSPEEAIAAVHRAVAGGSE